VDLLLERPHKVSYNKVSELQRGYVDASLDSHVAAAIWGPTVSVRVPVLPVRKGTNSYLSNIVPRGAGARRRSCSIEIKASKNTEMT